MDLQDVKTLTLQVNNTVPPGRFLSSFFQEDLLKTIHAELDVVTGTKKLVPFIREGGKATRSYRKGFEKRPFKCYEIKIERPTNAFDAFKALPGEPSVVVDPMDPNKRVAQLVGADTAEISNDINRTIEYLCAKAMFEGKYDILDEENKKIDSIDFGFKASHKVTLAGDNKWGGASANVAGNLEAMADLVGDSGRTAKHFVFGSKAWAEARKDEKFMKDFDRKFVTGNQMNLTFEKDDRGAILKGVFNGAFVWVYNEKCIPVGATQAVEMVPSNKVLAIGEGASLKLKYGCVGNVKDGFFVGTRFAKTWYDDKAEEQLLLMKSRPLPVIQEADALAVYTVCDA